MKREGSRTNWSAVALLALLILVSGCARIATAMRAPAYDRTDVSQWVSVTEKSPKQRLADNLACHALAERIVHEREDKPFEQHSFYLNQYEAGRTELLRLYQYRSCMLRSGYRLRREGQEAG